MRSDYYILYPVDLQVKLRGCPYRTMIVETLRRLRTLRCRSAHHRNRTQCPWCDISLTSSTNALLLIFSVYTCMGYRVEQMFDFDFQSGVIMHNGALMQMVRRPTPAQTKGNPPTVGSYPGMYSRITWQIIQVLSNCSVALFVWVCCTFEKKNVFRCISKVQV